MQSIYRQPLKVGVAPLVTIDGFVDIICQIAGKDLNKRYNYPGPQGVRGRNSDNTQIKEC